MNLNKFLTKNLEKCNGAYVLVTYQNKTEVIWFSKKDTSDEIFEAYKCEANKTSKVFGETDFFCRELISNSLIMPNDIQKEHYIEKHIKPLIKDNWLYNIDKLKLTYNLPSEVDKIKVINSKECLEFLLEKQT